MPERGYHKDFFSANIVLMKLSGIWSLFNRDKSTRCFYITTTIIFILILQIITTTDEIYLMKYIYHSMELFISHTGVVLTHVLGNVKIFIFFMNRKKIVELMDEVESNQFNYNFPHEINGYKIANDNKKVAKGSLLFFLGISTFVGLSRVIPSLGDAIWTVKKNNITCEEIFPFLLRTPFPTESTLGCLAAINYINIVIIAYAYQIICCDTMYAACLICLKSHISVLKKGFETIRIRCIGELKLKLDPTQHLRDSDYKELADMMNYEMKKCTLHLQSIIKNIQIIEEIYNKIILLQVLTVVAMMVTCLYMMSTVSMFSIDFLAQVIYLIALTTQVTLYCWFGNEITIAGSQIPMSIYQGDWLSATPGFKRSMMINMLRLNRDIHLTVGKFSPLTIATLVSIFRGSYSYFAVLKNVEN